MTLTRRFRPLIVGVLLVPLLATPALGGPLHFKSPAVCKTEGGSTVDIFPGRYIPEPEWQEVNERYKANEDRITRLEAENASLKQSAGEEFGWKSLTTAATLGILVGRYAWSK